MRKFIQSQEAQAAWLQHGVERDVVFLSTINVTRRIQLIVISQTS